MKIALTVNAEPVEADIPPRLHLGDFLRDTLGLTGTHLGCEHGVCGACTVRIDGALARACLVLAVQADGTRVETIEGLSDTGELADLAKAFHGRNALQCGYCTPGMLIAAQDLLLRHPNPDRDTIRDHLSGNYCRCTGYHAIIDAVAATAAARNATPAAETAANLNNQSAATDLAANTPSAATAAAPSTRPAAKNIRP